MTNNLKPRRRQPNVCMRCGSDQSTVEHKSAVVDFRGLTLEVDGLAQTACTKCQYTWETAGQQLDNLAILREAFASRRDEVRREEGLLTGEEVNFVLSQLQLSKAEAASIFGGGPNAFQKYISGEVLQSKAMDRLLRLAIGFGHQAVSFVRRGADAPLALYAGFFLVEQSSLESFAKSVDGFVETQRVASVIDIRDTSSTAEAA